MKLTINEKVGDRQTDLHIEGDYEEVLALISEIGYCNNVIKGTIQDFSFPPTTCDEFGNPLFSNQGE